VTAGDEPKFGVEATDNFTLRVSLLKPDRDFPALVAHPIFRPVYGDGKILRRIS
jgi:ABC-type oligopeptide transport system substrate-binding subunit